MRAGITRAIGRRLAVILACCAAVAGAPSSARQLSSGAAPTPSAVRLLTLGVPVGLMGKAFWVYADGRLIGSDRTLRVLQPAAGRHFTVMQTPAGVEIYGKRQGLVSFLYRNPCPKAQCGELAGRWELGARFTGRRPPFIETVALFVPTDMRVLQVVYGQEAGGVSDVPYLVGNSPYSLTANTFPIPDGFGDDILTLPPRSWGEVNAPAAAAAMVGAGDCFVRPPRGGTAGAAAAVPRIDIGEFSREFLWYNANPLVQALRASGGRPRFSRSAFAGRVTELTIATTRVPAQADAAYAADLAATTLAGTREYDEREVAVLAGAAAVAGTYFLDLPQKLGQCQRQYPQHAEVFARMLQLSQRIVAEVAQFQSLSGGAH